MEKNGWDCGKDDEELFELAMHPEQYRNYKSGQAKKNFLADLDKAKAARLQANGPKLSPEELSAFKHAKADAVVAPEAGQLFYEIRGGSDGTSAVEPAIGRKYAPDELLCHILTPWGEIAEVPACVGGTLVDLKVRQGGKVQRGATIAWIERPQ